MSNTSSSPALSLLVTGGAGYIGAVLVPELVAAGHRVCVFDCLLFGPEPLAAVADQIDLVEGDIRDTGAVDKVLARGFDAVIHLAAISNDPSSEIDPELTQAVNFTAVEHLMNQAKAAGVSRFLYASSASVYGIKETPDVTEDLELDPITIYARTKAEGESVLRGLTDQSFCGVAVRAATVCGDSPRLRLDLTINILTEHALNRGAIRVFGGSQMRPNIHIRDLADFYIHLLTADADAVAGKAFNVSAKNATVMELAEMIRGVVDPELTIDVEPTDDIRSYHLSAGRAERELGFVPRRGLEEAVSDVREALSNRISEPADPRYRNVEWMKRHPDFWRLGASLEENK